MKIQLRVWDASAERMLIGYKPEQGKREYVPFEFGIGFSHFDENALTLMLCTGLSDKDGNPVYEGDIISDGNGDKQVVYWDDEAAGFYKRPIDDESRSFSTGLRNLRFWKVCGNIYQSPRT